MTGRALSSYDFYYSVMLTGFFHCIRVSFLFLGKFKNWRQAIPSHCTVAHAFDFTPHFKKETLHLSWWSKPLKELHISAVIKTNSDCFLLITKNSMWPTYLRWEGLAQQDCKHSSGPTDFFLSILKRFWKLCSTNHRAKKEDKFNQTF